MGSHKNTRIVGLFVSATILATCVAGCGDDSGGGPSDTGGGTGDGGSMDAGPADGGGGLPGQCVAHSADCGLVSDGAGGTVSCGECTEAGHTCGGNGPNRCGEGTCAAQTCSDLGVECGLHGDGCMGELNCGACSDGLSCVEGFCIDESGDCGSEPANACGGCGALPIEPGDPCNCSDGMVATCSSRYPIVFCPDGDIHGMVELDQPATDDGVDVWTEVTGMLDVLPRDPAYPHQWKLNQDIDTFQVFVEDTLLGRFEPEIEYDHPGGFTAEICVEHDVGFLGLAWISCPDEFVGPLERSEDGPYTCCQMVEPTDTLVSFAVELLGTGVALDNEGNFRISVSSVDGPPMCASYAVRYRF